MSDLRHEAIEEMAKAVAEYDKLDEVDWEVTAEATAALDALLGFLKEHADEWLYEAAIAQPAVGIARKLLNILSDTEEE